MLLTEYEEVYLGAVAIAVGNLIPIRYLYSSNIKMDIEPKQLLPTCLTGSQAGIGIYITKSKLSFGLI